MIYVKIETHSRARKPRPRYMMAESWTDVLSTLSRQCPNKDDASENQWHTLKIRTISEAEYTKNMKGG